MNGIGKKIIFLNPFKKVSIALLSLIFIIFCFYPLPVHCAEKPQIVQKFQYTKSPEIQQVKPKKPVKIKLKRGAKGDYSWDLSGDNVDDIVRTDKRLRKLLEIE